MNPKQKKKWSQVDPVSMWNIVRQGAEITQFPPGYLDQEAARVIVRHLILNELQMSREELCKCQFIPLLREYQLGSVHKLFPSSREALQYCFPELHIEGWELTKVEPAFWLDEGNRSRFVEYVAAREGIDLTKLEDVRRISAVMVNSYGGSKALKGAGSLYELIRPVIPEEYKEWNVMKMNKWTEEKATEAMAWLVDQMGYDETTMANLTVKDFYDHDLGGLLQKYFHHSPGAAVSFFTPAIIQMKTEKNEKPKNLVRQLVPKVTTKEK